MKKQLFLSHNWGKNIYNEDNHQKVKNINNILTNLFGWNTWFDEFDMGWNLDGSMYNGISECDVALIFLTQKYISKIENNCLDYTNRDNCAKEWNLINMKNKPIIPIALEKNLTKTNNFNSPLVTMYINNHFIIDMSKISFESINKLHLWIIKNFNINPYNSTNLSNSYNLMKSIDLINLNSNIYNLYNKKNYKSNSALDLSHNNIVINKHLPIIKEYNECYLNNDYILKLQSYKRKKQENFLNKSIITNNNTYNNLNNNNTYNNLNNTYNNSNNTYNNSNNTYNNLNNLNINDNINDNINENINETPRQNLFSCSKLFSHKLPLIYKNSKITTR